MADLKHEEFQEEHRVWLILLMSSWNVHKICSQDTPGKSSGSTRTCNIVLLNFLMAEAMGETSWC